MKNARTVSPIKADGPIDVELIADATAKLGPLRITRNNSPYELDILATPCACGLPDCSELVISVWRRHGLLTRHWLVDREEFEQFGTLADFADWAFWGGLQDSRGERLLIEIAVQNELQQRYTDVNALCVCSSCATAMGAEALSQKSILSQMALDLQERDHLLNYAEEHLGAAGVELVERAFEAGYTLGRTYSEYAVKRGIEPDALKRMELLKASSKGGQARAHQAKIERDQVLVEMARLVREGMSVSSAAASAAKRGIGSSHEANRKAWTRHKPGT